MIDTIGGTCRKRYLLNNSGVCNLRSHGLAHPRYGIYGSIMPEIHSHLSDNISTSIYLLSVEAIVGCKFYTIPVPPWFS